MVTTVLHVICEDFFYFHYRSYNFQELLDIKRIVEYINSKQKYERHIIKDLPLNHPMKVLGKTLIQVLFIHI